MKRQVLSLLTAATLLSSSAMIAVAPDASAQDVRRNPIVKQGAIGAVVGTAVGAISKESSIWKGLGIGALTGVGTGLLSESSTMQRHPLVRKTAKGAVIGTGGAAVLGSGLGAGAAIGAGAGAGLHFLKKVFD